MAAAKKFLCLSFSFGLCSIYSPLSRLGDIPPIRLKIEPISGCTLSQWERATAVMGTAVACPFSQSDVFCNDAFCYKFPRLLNRFRPADLAPSPPDVQCVATYLKKGNTLHFLGVPDRNQSVLLPYSPTLPMLDDQSSLQLCFDASLLPPLPFNNSFVKDALQSSTPAEPDEDEVLQTIREQSHLQGIDPMSRQFAEVLLNVGVEQVNTQKYKEAIKTFNMVAGKAGLSAGVMIGRGTALALSGNLKEAILDYTKAIELEPHLIDAWRRRAQARTAHNDLKGAAEDFTQAMELARGKGDSQVDVLAERAMVYNRLKDHYHAMKDFRALVTLNPNDANAVVALGQSLSQLGEPEEAAEVLQKAVKLQPNSPVIWMHLAAAYKDMGEPKKAKEAYKVALRIQPNAARLHTSLASLLHALGDHKAALKSASKAVELDPNEVEGRYIKGSCQQALGDLASAVREYDQLLSVPGNAENQVLQFLGFYQRELASYTALHLRDSLHNFDVGTAFSAEFKQYWGKRDTPTELFPGYTIQPPRAALEHRLQPETGLPEAAKANRRKLIIAADAIGKRAQYTSTGFLPNQRQHRAAGMAAIEVMQALRASWEIPGSEDIEHNSEKSPFVNGWRDLYNMIVRWRQISEPCDPIVWIDQLTEEQFKSGFGSVTSMMAGHTKNNRYYSQFERAFSLLKEEILDSGQVIVAADEPGKRTGSDKILDLDPELGSQIEFAETCKELWDAVGQNFLVVAPCYSLSRPNHVLNGTNLVIVKLEEGFDFSIKTPLTPPRWRDYDREMTAAWDNLKAAMTDAELWESDVGKYRNRVEDAILRAAFYWYNFMPLARGTAMSGYVGILGMALAADLELTVSPPPAVQIDWEAILSPTFAEFKSRVGKWMFPSLKPVSSKLTDLPNVQASFPTLGSIITMLSDDAPKGKK